MIVKPSYYDKFRCTASRCSDNCCIGWEIDIDERTDQYYRQVTGDFGKRLEEGISRDGTPHFRLKGEKERCAFLNDQNLCDIFIHLGEEHLCSICREHPRFYEWYEDIPGLMDWTETGLGLCCEEAVRLLVSEPFGLVVQWESEEEQGQWEKMTGHPQTEEASYLLAVLSARETVFHLLKGDGNQNGAGPKGLADRSIRILQMAEEIQDCMDASGNLAETAESIRKISKYYQQLKLYKKTGKYKENFANEQGSEYFRQLFSVLRELEPMGDFWLNILNELDFHIDELLSLAVSRQEKETECCKRLMEYMIYRYFGKCAFDGDISSKVRLAVLFAVLVHLMDLNAVRSHGCLSREAQMEHIRLLSKEIEYSEENLEYLQNAFWSEESCSIEGLSGAVRTLWGGGSEDK